MDSSDSTYLGLRERVIANGGVLMVLGGKDTGKTTLARLLLADAANARLTAAYVDADIDQSTVGPPACVGLKWIRTNADLDRLDCADELRFVGSTSPQDVVLQHVVATSALVDAARERADLVIIDTTSQISGVVGQTLKYHKTELCHPDLVIAIQRGGELDPIVGMLHRFLGATVEMIDPFLGIAIRSPTEQRESRIDAFRRAFAPPLQRWRVQSTVFAPTLPEGFDFAKLDQMLVGLQDGQGRCIGIGALEHSDGTIRVVTSHGEGMQGLRLGSLRIHLDTFDTSRVRLRQLLLGT